MSRYKNSGFTLIELVVVIVILGVLAVTAAPRFLSLSSEANRSAIEGLHAALQGASNLAHSKSIIDGNENQATSTIVMGGSNVKMVYGYPEAFNGIVAASNLGNVEGYGRTKNNSELDWATQLISAKGVPGLAITTGKLSGDSPNAKTPAETKCYINYFQATATAEPDIQMDTSGC